jgi:hypothetical protein
MYARLRNPVGRVRQLDGCSIGAPSSRPTSPSNLETGFWVGRISHPIPGPFPDVRRHADPWAGMVNEKRLDDRIRRPLAEDKSTFAEELRA